MPTRLDELGRLPLARVEYRPLIGPTPRPPVIVQQPGAFPTFDAATIEELQGSDWNEFWAARPAGAGRLVPVAAASFDDAVAAARERVLASKPYAAPANRQAHAVLQAADGAWYVTGLGELVTNDWGEEGARLTKLSYVPNYKSPTVSPLVPELKAVVGGVSMIDFR